MDPWRDVERLDFEFLMADLSVMEKRIEKLQTSGRHGTPAEKEAFMARSRDTRNRFSVTTGGAGRANAPQPRQRTEEDFDWPDVKPPFVPRTVYAAPEGDLWVQRSTPARDSVPVYDVFNASGNLAARIALPKGRRLVGLGKGVAYATRTDDDGLQWLERYKR